MSLEKQLTFWKKRLELLNQELATRAERGFFSAKSPESSIASSLRSADAPMNIATAAVNAVSNAAPKISKASSLSENVIPALIIETSSS